MQGEIPTYNDLADDIERIVSMKWRKIHIPGFEDDDIKQEIRIICLKALAVYDPAKNHSTPFHYLARCVDNRLINLVRDNGIRLTRKQIENADTKAINKADRKRRLFYPYSLGHDIPEDALGEINESAGYAEFHDNVISALPPELVKFYCVLVDNGPNSIPKDKYRKIRGIVKELYPAYFA
ncbi:MAG: hypothetical protein JRD69_09845 [Deltaproteobacteria bacterium]|nr:hypothetical protein [Deltaproteobacteria bacterium]